MYQLISIQSGRIIRFRDGSKAEYDSHAEAWNALVKLTAAGYAVALLG